MPEISQPVEPRRQLPSIHSLLENPNILEAAGNVPRAYLKNFLRYLIKEVRNQPVVPGSKELVTWICKELSNLTAPYYRRMINATGVLLHTNLGRAPLPRSTLDYLTEVTTHFSNLEYNVETGKRGKRDLHLRQLLIALTGAEEALVVNNNAAALYLALHTLANQREAIISRGELIEIGDSFRIPEIIEASGALLREVGTTNRTHLRDYVEAISEKTALLVKAHPSNFSINGFTKETEIHSLVQLANEKKIPLLFDLGSSTLSPLDPLSDGTRTEDPSTLGASHWIEKGVDIITFSGDKLLGGPQAGILLGKKDLLEKLRRSPLYRALRLDKVNLAILDWLLTDLVQAEQDRQARWPIHEMMRQNKTDLEKTANALVEPMARSLTPLGLNVNVVDGSSTVGGGSLPGQTFPTRLVQVEGETDLLDQLDRFFRSCSPPIITRRGTGRGRILSLDVRTLLNEPEGKTPETEIIVQAAKEFAAHMSKARA